MSSLYSICQQYGIPNEHRQPLIDAYMKFVVAGLSPDFDALINLLSPYIFGGTVEGLTEGRIVHFVMPNGEHRPAIVVRNWENELTPPCEGYVNLQVFTDGMNDAQALPSDTDANTKLSVEYGLLWKTSICFDEAEKKPGTWHWIEKA